MFLEISQSGLWSRLLLQKTPSSSVCIRLAPILPEEGNTSLEGRFLQPPTVPGNKDPNGLPDQVGEADRTHSLTLMSDPLCRCYRAGHFGDHKSFCFFFFYFYLHLFYAEFTPRP